MTERAIKASDKEFKKNISDQQNICSVIKKEKDELNNTLAVIKASVSDLEARKKPLDIEKRKINDLIENLQIEIEQIGNDLKNSTVHFNDNERSLKKADKIISSEHQKLRDEEIKRVIGEVERKEGQEMVESIFKKNDHVKVVSGPFVDFNGVVEEVNNDKQKVTVTVSIFGRPTPVELDFFQLELEG